jgi:hypothetical protein
MSSSCVEVHGETDGVRGNIAVCVGLVVGLEATSAAVGTGVATDVGAEVSPGATVTTCVGGEDGMGVDVGAKDGANVSVCGATAEVLESAKPGCEMSVVRAGAAPGVQAQSGSPSSRPFD